jgi:beta-aspartyl-dipeptidase (metallo-type)
LNGICFGVYEGIGKIMIPGFIDVHQHVLGGGGEAGFPSRTPEAYLSQIISAGITTLVGILGTDSIGRDIKGLYAKVKVCFVFSSRL